MGVSITPDRVMDLSASLLDMKPISRDRILPGRHPHASSGEHGLFRQVIMRQVLTKLRV